MKSKNFNISENNLLKIFALIFAIVLWIYVQAQQLVPLDTASQSFNNIEIEWKTDPNYAVVAISSQSVNIRVRGLVDKINSLAADDVTMNLDLINYTDGKYTIELIPQLPRGVQLHSITPSTIEIVIDKWLTEEKEVEIEYLNELPSELIIESVSFEPSEVTVEGAKGSLDNIKKIVVPYNLDLQGTSSTDLKPEARDTYNKIITGVTVKQNVSVDINVKYRKWLPVKAIFTGELPEDITYKIQPARVEVLGQKSDLDIITEIFTADIDVSDIEKGDELDVEVVYPDHLEPSIQEYKTVKITFE